MICLLAVSIPASAEWLNHWDPHSANGPQKTNLAAPAPKLAVGTPEFSGIWRAPDGKYLANLPADGIEVHMQPWAEKLFNERPTTAGLAEWTLPPKQRKGPGALVGRVADFCVFFGTDHVFFN